MPGDRRRRGPGSGRPHLARVGGRAAVGGGAALGGRAALGHAGALATTGRSCAGRAGAPRRRPPRPAAGGCRSPRGRPRSGGGQRGSPTRCRPRAGSRRASVLPCPGSSPARPSRPSQRVQPAQDDTLPQRPRTDPHARYVERAHRCGSHYRAGRNLVRAVGETPRSSASAPDSIRDTKPTSWSSPSRVSSRGTRSPGRVGRGPGEPGERAERLAGGGHEVGLPGRLQLLGRRAEQVLGVGGELRPAPPGPAARRPGRRAGTAGSSGRRPAATRARRRGPRRCPLASSRDPPPMSRTSSCPALQPNHRRTARKVSRASSSPVSTCRSTPVRCADAVEHLQPVRRVADRRGHQRQQLVAALLLGLRRTPPAPP